MVTLICRMNLITIFYGFLLVIQSHATEENMNKSSAERRLLHDLFKDYHSDTRPVLNASQPVQVEIELIITKVVDLNTKDQSLTTLSWLNVNWTDERLPWNKSDYDEISHVAVDPSKLWLPDFTLVNSGDGSLFNDNSFKLYKAIIYHNGSILWRPSGKFVSSCEIDITYFPFDEQMCSFSFINWAYSSDQVNLTYTKKAMERFFKRYSSNSEWDIVRVSVGRKDMHYNFGPELFPEVHFNIIFKRKPMIYVVNILIITVCFAFILLSSFKLPVKSGERITMIVSLLVAFSVLILSIQHNIPQTSNTVPFITIYMVSFMCLNTLGIFETVFVLYLFHHKTNSRPPKWVRNFGTKLRSIEQFKTAYICPTFCKADENHINSSYQQLNIQEPCESEEELNSRYEKPTVRSHKNSQPFARRKKISFKYKANPQRRSCSFVNQKDKNGQKEWELMAQTVDKCCFWLFVFIFFMLILILISIGANHNNIHDLHQSDIELLAFP